MAEKRRDPTDPKGSRKVYTRQQFLDFHGKQAGARLWRGAGGAEEEKRRDPTDPGSKKRYTRAEFADFYGPQSKSVWRQAGALESLPNFEVVYFDIAGKAEASRLALAHAGVPFKDTRLNFEKFGELKASGKLPFGQVPVLLVSGKGRKTRCLSQSAAMVRYIAQITSKLMGADCMYPSDPELAAVVDAIVDQETDMMTSWVASQYANRFGFGSVVNRGDDASPEQRRNLSAVRRAMHDDILPRSLDAFAQMLRKSKTGWLAGTAGPSIADFVVVPTLQRLRGRADGPPIGVLADGMSAGLIDSRPELVQLINKMSRLPGVKALYRRNKKEITYQRLPRLGFGTFNNFEGAPLEGEGEDQVLADSVAAALKCGYKHFDCAEFYRNEVSIGRTLAKAIQDGNVTRSELFLVSKVWNNHRTAEAINQSVDATLKALQTDYLDMYLIHWPVCWEADDLVEKGKGDMKVAITVGKPDPRGEEKALAEAWAAMEGLVKAGKVRQIGVSNFGVKRLKRLAKTAKIRPACNQVECHPHLVQEDLLKYCKSQAIDMVAYHPIGKPNFRKEGQPVAIKEPVVVGIAEKKGVTPAQVIIAWHLARGVVAIPKSCTPSRIEENLKAGTVTLDADEVKAISALDQNMHFCAPDWMPNWD
eukprot:TRINITY_DN4108_c2_g1_i1.p1 TRINITY_DN4108_c2_g1~~TRINITY_DN4108_c2_g1_i1.p1  ORF type:complete len:647 (+),score=233.66 TRINITY_DN4108_c2_g1_i1:78-2018(+)